jgi:hypothetical protein
MKKRSKKQALQFQRPVCGRQVTFAIHAPFIEEHFAQSRGRLGLTVATVPNIDLHEDQRSRFDARCIFIPAEHDAFAYVAEACGDELLDALDPSADMLLMLTRQSDDPDRFDNETLLVIRNARDPQSVPEEIARN